MKNVLITLFLVLGATQMAYAANDKDGDTECQPIKTPQPISVLINDK